MSANSSLSSATSTPSPVLPVQKMSQQQHRTLPLEPRPLSLSPTTLPYHSRLHEALTQPRLPQQPVKCHRCGLELTSRCLMQTCADDTRCRLCGQDLTTKCILQVCTIPPKESPLLLQTQSGSQQSQSQAPRKRVHHYSTPQWISTSNNGSFLLAKILTSKKKKMKQFIFWSQNTTSVFFYYLFLNWLYSSIISRAKRAAYTLKKFKFLLARFARAIWPLKHVTETKLEFYLLIFTMMNDAS